MLRLLFFLPLFVSPVLAEGDRAPVDPEETPAASAPRIAKEALVGKWHLDTKLGGVAVTAVTDYKPDGTLESRAVLVIDGESIELSVKARWKFEGTTLVTTVTESSHPDFVEAGEVDEVEILELSPQVLRYRDEDGVELRETREPAAARPVLQGEALPADEVKAIHAAIGAMERAFREADYDAILKGTHPSLIARVGGEEEYREMLESAVAMIQSGEVKIGDAELDAPAVMYRAGEERVCFVPKRNTVEAADRKMRNTGFFVAIRDKSGEDWRLLDGAGLRSNPGMLWLLLPELPRDLELPENKSEEIHD
jgi:ketosteroid isomerase-like protein